MINVIHVFPHPVNEKSHVTEDMGQMSPCDRKHGTDVTMWLGTWDRCHHVTADMRSMPSCDWGHEADVTMWLRTWDRSHHVTEDTRQMSPCDRKHETEVETLGKRKVHFILTTWPQMKWRKSFHRQAEITWPISNNNIQQQQQQYQQLRATVIVNRRMWTTKTAWTTGTAPNKNDLIRLLTFNLNALRKVCYKQSQELLVLPFYKNCRKSRRFTQMLNGGGQTKQSIQ